MQLKIVKPSTEAERSTRTTLDTIEVTPDLVRSWKLPPFQRELRVNEKLIAISRQIKEDDGVIPGVITLGVLNKERYIVDGQHRREAYLLSENLVGYCDVRVLHFANMAEMGEEYVRLNSRIVNMKPDDIMRGLEESYPALARIRRRCPFVGYGQIRRSERAPVLSMSALLRCWHGSGGETPKSGGASAIMLATSLTDEASDEAVGFLDLAFKAWGRDQAYVRLWGNLNLTLCMWIYRRVVLGDGLTSTSRSHRFTKEHFAKCLMSLSADSDYVDWLLGRNSMSRDNTPAYTRIKAIFAKRMETEIGRKILMPSPSWAVSK